MKKAAHWAAFLFQAEPAYITLATAWQAQSMLLLLSAVTHMRP